MIGQMKGNAEQKVGERRRRKWKRERAQRRRKKKSGAKADGLEKPQILRGLIDVEDGRVAVEVPNLGTQHVIILTELCFHCQGICGLESYHNKVGLLTACLDPSAFRLPPSPFRLPPLQVPGLLLSIGHLLLGSNVSPCQQFFAVILEN